PPSMKKSTADHSAVFFALSECTRVAFKSDKLHFLGTPKFKRLPQALFVPIPLISNCNGCHGAYFAENQ
ncbi:hypothetical protein P4H87_31895, partial [Paenibacillus macerans]